MNTRWLLIGFILLLPLSLAALAPQRSTATGEIWGKVINPETGEALEGIMVVVPDRGIGARTGEDGNFILTDIPLGSTEVVFDHPCFYRVSVNVTLTQSVSIRRISIGIPYDYETEARTGCDWRMGGEQAAPPR